EPSEFDVERVVGVEQGNRKLPHVFVEIPRTERATSLKRSDRESDSGRVKHRSEVTGFLQAVSGRPIQLVVDECGGVGDDRSRKIHAALSVDDSVGRARELLGEFPAEIKLLKQGKP